jgi:stearoyl-CoA desaturase (Delta-9 desaturase)
MTSSNTPLSVVDAHPISTAILEPKPTDSALLQATEALALEEDGPADHMDEPLAPPSIGAQVGSLLAIVMPIAGLIAACVMLWSTPFSWLYLALLGTGYVATTLGVTIGFHRYFTHKSFKTNKVITTILGVLGSMSIQGPILTWVATHRRHHQHTDRDEDPHSPHTHGTGFWAWCKGMYHSHLGWFFAPEPGKEVMDKYVPDLEADPLVRRLSKLFPLWATLGLVLPAGIAFAVTGSWMGCLLGLIWGGLVRLFVVHHITWSINSVCHLWGGQPFNTHDHSRNNALFGLLALGEGWHNNHHAFPASARQGLRWWQIDVSYWIIRLLGYMGLAKDIKVVSPERIAAKLARPGK